MDVVLRSVQKRYGDQLVLSDLTANFPEGSITCIMGPSGCGKTTLLRLILGLEQADAGELLGIDVPKAAVFQEHRLFEAVSPVSNVAAVLPGRPDQSLLCEELSHLGLAHHLHVPTRTLSGGMKRRVALARAMLAPAALVVLDEPFTGLDLSSKEHAMSFVKRHAREKTILLVTHDPTDPAFLDASTLWLTPNS